jgi:hypothetical protein
VTIASMTSPGRSAALVVVALAVGARDAPAQPWMCYAIQPGDTAAILAMRLTGDAHAMREPWFQILDPAASRFIAKARYDDIQAGWRVCVSMARRQPGAGGASPAPHSPIQSARTVASIDLDYRWFGVATLALAPIGWYVAGRRRKRRRAVIDAMTQFGESFICEFERPLLQLQPRGRAVRSRLRFQPHRGRLEVLLAPGAGRTYPNLSDHRRNMEYDMERVLEALRDQSFVCNPLRQRRCWVVVPFQIRPRPKQEGVT